MQNSSAMSEMSETSAAELQERYAEAMLQAIGEDAGGVALDVPVWEQGVALFRRRWTLRLPLAQRGESIELQAGSHLRLGFGPIALELDAGDSHWVKHWDESDHQRVRVDLVRPGNIRRVRCDAFDRVAFHRADGNAVSDEAVVTAATDQAMSTGLVAQSLVLVLSEPSPVPDRLEKRSARDMRKAKKKAHQAAVKHGGAMSRDAADVVKDALQEARSWLSLELRGLPTSPRLKLLDADGELLWQWQAPGAQSSAEFEAGEADLAAISSAINRALGKLASAATQLELSLVAESDEPCRLPEVDFSLSARWLQPALAGEGGGSLQFSGEAAEQREVMLEVPANTACHLALDLNLAGNDGSAGAPAQPSDQRGLFMHAGYDAALAFDLAAPSFSAGACISWWPLSSGVKLHLSLHQDAGDAPGGVVAEATLQREVSEAGPWLFRWERAPLQAGRHWWCLHCEEGEGVWLGAPGLPPRLFERYDDRPWSGVALDVLPVVTLLDQAASGAPLAASLGGSSLAIASTGESRWRVSGNIGAGAAQVSVLLVGSRPLLVKPAGATVDWPATLQLIEA